MSDQRGQSSQKATNSSSKEKEKAGKLRQQAKNSPEGTSDPSAKGQTGSSKKSVDNLSPSQVVSSQRGQSSQKASNPTNKVPINRLRKSTKNQSSTQTTPNPREQSSQKPSSLSKGEVTNNSRKSTESHSTSKISSKQSGPGSQVTSNLHDIDKSDNVSKSANASALDQSNQEAGNDEPVTEQTDQLSTTAGPPRGKSSTKAPIENETHASNMDFQGSIGDDVSKDTAEKSLSRLESQPSEATTSIDPDVPALKTEKAGNDDEMVSNVSVSDRSPSEISQASNEMINLAAEDSQSQPDSPSSEIDMSTSSSKAQEDVSNSSENVGDVRKIEIHVASFKSDGNQSNTEGNTVVANEGEDQDEEGSYPSEQRSPENIEAVYEDESITPGENGRESVPSPGQEIDDERTKVPSRASNVSKSVKVDNSLEESLALPETLQNQSEDSMNVIEPSNLGTITRQVTNSSKDMQQTTDQASLNKTKSSIEEPTEKLTDQASETESNTEKPTKEGSNELVDALDESDGKASDASKQVSQATTAGKVTNASRARTSSSKPLQSGSKTSASPSSSDAKANSTTFSKGKTRQSLKSLEDPQKIDPMKLSRTSSKMERDANGSKIDESNSGKKPSLLSRPSARSVSGKNQTSQVRSSSTLKGSQKQNERTSPSIKSSRYSAKVDQVPEPAKTSGKVTKVSESSRPSAGLSGEPSRVSNLTRSKEKISQRKSSLTTPSGGTNNVALEKLSKEESNELNADEDSQVAKAIESPGADSQQSINSTKGTRLSGRNSVSKPPSSIKEGSSPLASAKDTQESMRTMLTNNTSEQTPKDSESQLEKQVEIAEKPVTLPESSLKMEEEMDSEEKNTVSSGKESNEIQNNQKSGSSIVEGVEGILEKLSLSKRTSKSSSSHQHVSDRAESTGQASEEEPRVSSTVSEGNGLVDEVSKDGGNLFLTGVEEQPQEISKAIEPSSDSEKTKREDTQGGLSFEQTDGKDDGGADYFGASEGASRTSGGVEVDKENSNEVALPNIPFMDVGNDKVGVDNEENYFGPPPTRSSIISFVTLITELMIYSFGLSLLPYCLTKDVSHLYWPVYVLLVSGVASILLRTQVIHFK